MGLQDIQLILFLPLCSGLVSWVSLGRRGLCFGFWPLRSAFFGLGWLFVLPLLRFGFGLGLVASRFALFNHFPYGFGRRSVRKIRPGPFDRLSFHFIHRTLPSLGRLLWPWLARVSAFHWPGLALLGFGHLSPSPMASFQLLACIIFCARILAGALTDGPCSLYLVLLLTSYLVSFSSVLRTQDPALNIEVKLGHFEQVSD